MRILAMLAILSATAAADAPKYTRKQTVTVDAPRSERTKPIAPRELPPAAPTVTGAQVMHLEESKDPARNAQARILEDLIDKTSEEDPEKPELMFRLAELYAKQYRFWNLKAIEATFTKD
ncbi:MAG TPA: hypothetical protein VGM88_17825 [Kofleriaceae bacterium]|jgi:hypothetical protein